ncbi:inhibitor of Bruton tyrosine kinase [Episyrphus balteatus]|uniref:inhibitor of Bruton tyrosine kinase n=1 Tax=Episyrphus balteatus TaxID=286459 RepID=UPI0024856B64|nr:inhibitor of Bruton tyrosine kinase [Episyrphus balteatus]
MDTSKPMTANSSQHIKYKVNNYEYDCTKKCRCDSHGQEITAALTKRAVDDNKLAAFIAKKCCNFFDITDPLGRSAVHMAASVDRYVILEWLLNQGAIINSRDKESGSSALHRSIYYGCIDCAVLLLRYGASLELLDEDTRSPLQNCCRLFDFSSHLDIPTNTELLVWGSNKNYNLGIGNEEGASTPQFIDFFRKEQKSVELISLSAYHSLFVDKKGQLYAVGHGKGGRLGNGTEISLPIPKKVKVPIKNAGEKIICISTSKKHSLILTNKSAVFACGLNEDMQLGVRDNPEKLTVFKEVVTLRDFGVNNLKSVIARDFHSLAYSKNMLWVWGTNHGQFGWSSKGEAGIAVPRQIPLPERTELEFVESNNYAIACYTTAKSIILFYNYRTKSIKPPQIEALKSISVTGGGNTKAAKGSVSALKILMLTETNVVFIWYEMSQQYLRCSFSHIRVTQIDKIFYKANQVLILSQGDVYTGKCHQVPIQNYQESSADAWFTDLGARKDICNDQKVRIELSRIPQLDRVVDIFCNDDLTSFAVLQESYANYFVLPKLIMEEYSFKKLLNDASEFDNIHDLVFYVDGENFFAHKFIIYSRSAGLREIVEKYSDKKIYLNFQGLTGKMFELILKNIYTNYFITEDDLDDIQQSLGPNCPAERDQVLELFVSFVEKFQLNSLANFIKSHSSQLPRSVDRSKYRFKCLKREDFPALYDVTIRCGGDVEINAHKCILVSRLEYFDLMFTHTWSERTTINLSTVPPEYMIPIIDFLYTLNDDNFRKQNPSEVFLYNMIVYCDQFFIEQLRKVCEVLLLEKINIRKCGEMLDFACLYNCSVLKKGCLDFICQNLYRVLSQKSLECCEPEALNSINAHYRQMFKEVFDYRMITPDSDAVCDEILLSFVDDFEVDLDFRMEEDDTIKPQTKVQKRETKFWRSTRQHEQDAINSMKEMSLQDSRKESISEKSSVIKEADEVSAKIHDEYKSWLKVADKKDIKKKTVGAAVAVVNANEVLKVEPKPKEALVPLTPRTEKVVIPEETTPTKEFNINLAEFTPIKADKLSQKQRKRLSSESWRGEPLTPSKPIAVPQVTPNAWGISSPSVSNDLNSSFLSSSSSLTKESPCKPGSLTSPSTSGTNFTKILQDEKKQREYVDRMRNKSLVLTQIEETAITELRQFYNVDNAADEIITIERKQRPVTMNFAIWQRN